MSKEVIGRTTQAGSSKLYNRWEASWLQHGLRLPSFALCGMGPLDQLWLFGTRDGSFHILHNLCHDDALGAWDQRGTFLDASYLSLSNICLLVVCCYNFFCHLECFVLTKCTIRYCYNHILQKSTISSTTWN